MRVTLPLIMNKQKLNHLANLGRLGEVEGISERHMRLAGIKHIAKKPQPVEKKPYVDPKIRASAPIK